MDVSLFPRNGFLKKSQNDVFPKTPAFWLNNSQMGGGSVLRIQFYAKKQLWIKSIKKSSESSQSDVS